jgi:NADH-quinone oxidoreductase subunit L
MPLIWLILFTPFIGFLTAFLLGRKRNAIASWLTVSLTGLNLIFSIILLLQTLHTKDNHLIYNWFTLNGKAYQFGFLFDSLTLMMLVLVNFIALLVEIFSLEYMENDPDLYRYFGFLSLFVFSMLGIVLTDNLFVMYGFWELVGLSSYLLIGFWYKKPEAVQASKKAFLMNRIGDVGFLIGIFAVYFYNGHSTDLTTLKSSINLPTIYCLLLFCGCIAKSAQFPLHTWLPDAMEGPTPVSALIHAATMVVAGIYLLIRVSPMFDETTLAIVAGIGAITMILGSIYAIFQTDIKKTLAYSTVSQLGLMVIGLGSEASTFHLLTHAFFKAGLFLCAGAIIHTLHHTGENFDAQDMRLMGGLRKKMPFVFICYLVCSMALMGLPLFSGFLSKDAILNIWFPPNNDADIDIFHLIIICSILLGIILTTFYMTRQIWMIFFGEFRNEKTIVKSIHEGSWKMKLPIAILAMLSTGFVFSINPLSVGHSWFWNFNQGFLWVLNKGKIEENHWIGIISTSFALIGITAGYLTRHKIFTFGTVVGGDTDHDTNPSPWSVSSPTTPPLSVSPQTTEPIPTFDNFYNKIFVNPTLKLSNIIQFFDQRILDSLVNLLADLQVFIAKFIGWFDAKVIDSIPNGTVYSAGIIGRVTRSAQGGKVQLYVALAFLGLIGLLFFVILL